MGYPWDMIVAVVIGLVGGVVVCQLGKALGRRKATARLPAGEVLAPQPKAEPKKPVAAPRTRSEALTLLSALQREARFVDFVKEPLEGYSDAQIGAVARDVHRDCGKVLERLFALTPVTAQRESEEIEVTAGFDPARYRLTGSVEGEPPFRGRMAHHGWEATRCDLPVWSGKEATARIIAPVEVELK